MISFEFKGWNPFSAKKKPEVVRKWLHRVADEAQRVFTKGMLGRHSGQIYYRRTGTHQASAPGEYPANDTGNLLASMRKHVTTRDATIGTNVFYAKFLREGTGKMARRKMSDNAMEAGAQKARPSFRGWVQWVRGR